MLPAPVGIVLGLLGHWTIGRWFLLPMAIVVGLICFVIIPTLIFQNHRLRSKKPDDKGP